LGSGLAGSTAFTVTAATTFTVTTATATFTTSTTEATAATTTAVSTLGSGTVGLLGVVFEPLSVLGEGGLDVLGSGPEIRGEELVGVGNSLEAGLDEVLGSSGGTGGGSEDIIDTSELQDLLGDGGSDETGTTGGGGQLEAAGATLTSRLGGDSVDVPILLPQ